MAGSIDASESRDSWHECLSRLQGELQLIEPDPTPVHNEAEFRTLFLQLNEDENEPNPGSNLGRFLRFHDVVHVFARSIDDSVGLNTTPSVKELFWTIALATLKNALPKEEFEDFSKVYSILNHDFPSFTFGELAQFPHNLAVQECLQLIFDAYYKCYLELIRQALADDEDIDTKSVEEQSQSAVVVYQTQKKDWEARCETATIEAENRRKRTISTTSSGSGGSPEASFVFLRELGKGSYGKVDMVRETTTGLVYARKIIPLDAGGNDPAIIEKQVKNEAEIMTKLRHNHIASVNMLFVTDAWNIIMSPVADMDLRVFLEDLCIKQDYPVDLIRKIDPWFGCLISALAYAHDEQVKHEDIKPRNILIQRNKIFLTDFGTAKDFSEAEASTVTDYLEQGTPIYWAPEQRAWGRAADVFALGCVFAEMLTVRQRKSLKDFRRFRYNNNVQGFGYAFASGLPKTRRWLKDMLGIGSKDPTAQTILEQTLNMLIENNHDRLEAKRIKRNFRVDEQLFCNSCS